MRPVDGITHQPTLICSVNPNQTPRRPIAGGLKTTGQGAWQAVAQRPIGRQRSMAHHSPASRARGASKLFVLLRSSRAAQRGSDGVTGGVRAARLRRDARAGVGRRWIWHVRIRARTTSRCHMRDRRGSPTYGERNARRVAGPTAGRGVSVASPLESPMLAAPVLLQSNR